jgi:hypothetical protein
LPRLWIAGGGGNNKVIGGGGQRAAKMADAIGGESFRSKDLLEKIYEDWGSCKLYELSIYTRLY